MTRLFFALLLPLAMIGCAENASPAPEESDGPATEQADSSIAEAGEVSAQAKPRCTDNDDGTTTCCTPKSCVTF